MGTIKLQPNCCTSLISSTNSAQHSTIVPIATLEMITKPYGSYQINALRKHWQPSPDSTSRQRHSMDKFLEYARRSLAQTRHSQQIGKYVEYDCGFAVHKTEERIGAHEDTTSKGWHRC
eukprot:IDg1535t1